MKAVVGWVEGTCSRCRKTLRRKHPEGVAVCDCYRYCPLCGAEMEPFSPDLNPSTYAAEESLALEGQVVDSSGWTVETLGVCYNHLPPYYTSQKPVEVKLW